MGWALLPAAVGDVVEADQVGELRAAIVERRRAVGFAETQGLGDPPEVSTGDISTAATVNAYRQRVENLLAYYVDVNHARLRWTKSAALQEAIGKLEWTNVPARAGAPSDGALLSEGTVMYVEHLNEMKAVIDVLYLVPLDEKAGREYCEDDGTGWVWSSTCPSPYVTAMAGGDYQLGTTLERGQSAPYDFDREPIGGVPVSSVRASGILQGTGGDLTVKHIFFADGLPGDSQPVDRDWAAELRVSENRPAASPRGEDTEVFYENNLADDGSHTSDSKNDDANLLEVYVDDEWAGETIPAPQPPEWPFWITTILEEHEDVVSAYAAEAIATGRELADWYGSVYFPVYAVWAEAAFEYM